MTTTCPMPAAVAPPPIGPGSTTATVNPAAADGLAGKLQDAIAMRAGRGCGSEELDMVDGAAVCAGDALPVDALPDAPCVIGQYCQAVECESLSVVSGEEEPIPAPRDVARD